MFFCLKCFYYNFFDWPGFKIFVKWQRDVFFMGPDSGYLSQDFSGLNDHPLPLSSHSITPP